MCVNPMDRQTVCSQRHWFTELPVHHTVEEQWRLLFFLTNSDDTSFDFYFYFYIFLYEIMISDPEMPLFHMERFLFLCICIYVYLYVCRLCYVLYVSPRFLEALVTVLM